jgi:hypothetical protein
MNANLYMHTHRTLKIAFKSMRSWLILYELLFLKLYYVKYTLTTHLYTRTYI